MSVESIRSTNLVPTPREPRPHWPDLGRADVGLLLTSRWRVNAVDSPRSAAERAAQAWSQSSTPTGLLASHVFITADDRKLVRISQWRDDEDPAPATPAAPSPRARGKAIVPIAEPTVEHVGTRLYRPYRSGIYRRPDEYPGALFVVELELTGPGSAKDWVELIFAAVAEAGVPEGLLAGHFYLSDDGRRAVNLAEWSSEEAHRRAVDDRGGFMGSNPAWESVRAFASGRVSVENYRLLRTTAHVV